jgi:hypothetical protein
MLEKYLAQLQKVNQHWSRLSREQNILKFIENYRAESDLIKLSFRFFLTISSRINAQELVS